MQTGALLLLSALWGGSFPFMKIAAPALGPVVLIELRVLIAGLALTAYLALRRTLPDVRSHWRQYLVIGGLNSAAPFLLAATASLYLPASLLATLNATTPLFGALVSAVWIGERLTIRKLAGLLTGFAGVVALMGLSALPPTLPTLLAAGASLCAALAYGTAAVYTRVRAAAAPARALAAYSQLAAALLIAPLVPFAMPAAPPARHVIGAVFALALVCTAVAYLLYFYLIAAAGPTRATMVTFLAPAFGMLWSAALLREPLGLAHAVGFGLILASVALVRDRRVPGRPVGRARAASR